MSFFVCQLAYKQEIHESPIMNIQIIHNEEKPISDSYKKNLHDLNSGDGKEKIYLCTQKGKYLSEGAAREWSTVVDISISPPSFKPVSLYLSRSPLSKTPTQVFFNPINIFDSFTHSITVFII